jgi:hypothetical protein
VDGPRERERASAHEERFSRPAAATARYRDDDDDDDKFGGRRAAAAAYRGGDELEMSERYRADAHEKWSLLTGISQASDGSGGLGFRV